MTHWAWGLPVGAGLGWYYGDSEEEIILGAALTSPWGIKAAAKAGQMGGKGLLWTARTNAARSLGLGLMRITGAIAIPVVAGYAISYAIAGKSGVSDFHDYITGDVSPQKWWDTVTLKSMR